MQFPPQLQLCGALICKRDGTDLTVYDQHGHEQYSRRQFFFSQVVRRGGESIILGVQSRSGRHCHDRASAACSRAACVVRYRCSGVLAVRLAASR